MRIGSVVCGVSKCLIFACSLFFGLTGWGDETALVVTEATTDVAEPAAAPLMALRADLEFLADDARKGREPGTPEIEEAAEHIAGVFRDLGLETELFDGEPFQPFEVDMGARAGDGANNRVTRLDEKAEAATTYNVDEAMQPLTLGASGTASGPVVFAGYGITAPELNYDDYAGIDAEGAIVVLLRKTPAGGQDNPFAERANQKYAYFVTKVQNAVQHGAAGVLIINDPASVQEQKKRLESRLERERAQLKKLQETIDSAPEGLDQVLQRLSENRERVEGQVVQLRQELSEAEAGLLDVGQAGGGSDPAKIPVASFSRVIASQWLQEALGKPLVDLESSIADAMTPQSAVLEGVRVRLQTEVIRARVETSNVVGVLPGRGELADETIVIGAHYDHVGMGRYGSLAPGVVAIHNGADDNASGTVTMMEVARRLVAQLDEAPERRRLVFIAFSAEERGLLGSKHYVEAPRFPLARTAAMINLDMVGRLNDNELTVYGTGTASEFDGLLDRLNEQHGFNLVRSPSGYGPSDHTSFYQKKIPVLFFFTGLHNDYHRPSDDFDKINFGGLGRITDMVTDAARSLATGPRPTYQPTEPGGGVRRQMTVWLGIRMREQSDSVAVSEVSPESPAQRAGLLVGDIIAAIDDKKISSSDDILGLLRRKKPGDRIELKVSRQEQTEMMEAILADRP